MKSKIHKYQRHSRRRSNTAVADFSLLEIRFLLVVIDEELRRLRHVAHVTGELRLRH